MSQTIVGFALLTWVRTELCVPSGEELPVSEPLVIENVFSGYDQADVLTGVSLTVPEGQITCLLGSNGAGKTTTMRMLMGLSTSSGGTLRVFGVLAGELGRADRARVGLVPQEDTLDPDLSVVCARARAAPRRAARGLARGLAPAVLARS